MLRVFSTIRKELLILMRDKGGLATLFAMPMVLVCIMAIIQDAPFRDYQELNIPVIFKDKDHKIIGTSLEQGLDKTGIFNIYKQSFTDGELKKAVNAGKYQVGIIIPDSTSDKLIQKTDQFVSQTLAQSGIPTAEIKVAEKDLSIKVFFAPNIKNSFRRSTLSSLRQFSSEIQTNILLQRFKRALNSESQQGKENDTLKNILKIEELTEDKIEQKGLNSVQHNVPAWTMFGMFFIVIAISGSIIKEREDGSYLRILVMPGSYITVMAGKIAAFLSICLIQCGLMLLMGIYFLPLLGLPTLVIGNNLIAIIFTAICSGLAATGFGVLIGTFFNTYQQSSAFGSISVVILAALGGIWIPIYVMPESIRIFAEVSPLYWGLSSFNNIFLNNGTIQSTWTFSWKLLTFFVSTMSMAYLINQIKYRNR